MKKNEEKGKIAWTSLDDPEVETITASSFCLEEFARSLSGKLRQALEALMDWGEQAMEKLRMTSDEFSKVKRSILKALREYIEPIKTCC